MDARMAHAPSTTIARRATARKRRSPLPGIFGGGKRDPGWRGSGAPPAGFSGGSAFDQTHFPGARTLAGILGRELHALALAQQLEHRAAHGAAMEEVLDPALVADESEPLVYQQSSDGPGRHTRVLR